MYLTVKQKVKHLSKEDYKTIKHLCRVAKSLTNQAIFNVRQYYFNEGEYLNYEKNYDLLKTSDNYKMLNSNMAQQILKEVDGSFKSFFGLLKLARKGKYAFKDCRLPNYLPKDGYTTLVIGFVRLNGNKLILPYSNAYKKTHKCVEITIPPILLDKKIKETPNVEIVSGDYLIDDSIKNGAAEFEGEHIQIHSEKFPNWHSVLIYLSQRESLNL